MTLQMTARITWDLPTSKATRLGLCSPSDYVFVFNSTRLRPFSLQTIINAVLPLRLVQMSGEAPLDSRLRIKTPVPSSLPEYVLSSFPPFPAHLSILSPHASRTHPPILPFPPPASSRTLASLHSSIYQPGTLSTTTSPPSPST